MKILQPALSAIVLLALAGGSTAFGAQPGLLPGTYDADARGLKGSIEVDELGDLRLEYAIDSECGRERGALDFDETPSGAYVGRESTRQGSIVARLKPDGGAALAGSLRYARQEDDRGVRITNCRFKRTFDAALNPKTSPVVDGLTGRYAGAGTSGQPISFDVGFNQRRGEIRMDNFTVQAGTECLEDLNGDGADDTLVVRLSGLEGSVDPDGSFEIDDGEGDTVSVYAEGSIRNGVAEVDIEIGGLFGADGVPTSGGPFDCETLGETYTASRFR